MVWSKKVDNRNGLQPNFGNQGSGIDDESNDGDKMASTAGKRIGLIKGRIRVYSGPHSADTTLNNERGLNRYYGNGFPTEPYGTGPESPSRGTESDETVKIREGKREDIFEPRENKGSEKTNPTGEGIRGRGK